MPSFLEDILHYRVENWLMGKMLLVINTNLFTRPQLLMQKKTYTLAQPGPVLSHQQANSVASVIDAAKSQHRELQRWDF